MSWSWTARTLTRGSPDGIEPGPTSRRGLDAEILDFKNSNRCSNIFAQRGGRASVERGRAAPRRAIEREGDSCPTGAIRQRIRIASKCSVAICQRVPTVRTEYGIRCAGAYSTRDILTSRNVGREASQSPTWLRAADTGRVKDGLSGGGGLPKLANDTRRRGEQSPRPRRRGDGQREQRSCFFENNTTNVEWAGEGCVSGGRRHLGFDIFRRGRNIEPFLELVPVLLLSAHTLSDSVWCLSGPETSLLACDFWDVAASSESARCGSDVELSPISEEFSVLASPPVQGGTGDTLDAPTTIRGGS